MPGRIFLGWLLAASAVFGASGCGSSEPEIIYADTPDETLITYTCEEDRTFQALFKAGQSRVTLTIDEREYVLEQVPSGSGIAFSNGAFTFYAKGLEAHTRGWVGGDFTDCHGENE